MGDGNFQSSTPPLLGGLEAAKVHSDAQFRELGADDAERKFQRMTVWSTIPEKYQAGDVYFFAAGIVGAQAGLYYHDGSGWVFTGNIPTARGTLYSNTSTPLSVAITDTKIAPWTLAGSTPVDVVQDPTAGTLTINRAGLYFAQAFVDFLNPAPNLTWEIVYYRNGAEAPLTRTRLSAKDNNDGVNLQTIIVALLNVGDVIDVRMKCSAAQTINIVSKIFSLVEQ